MRVGNLEICEHLENKISFNNFVPIPFPILMHLNDDLDHFSPHQSAGLVFLFSSALRSLTAKKG